VSSPLLFSADAVSASGTLATVFSIDGNGLGPCRIYVKNVGTSNALTAAKIQVGPDVNHLVDLDTTTFASLAANGGKGQLLIPAPVDKVVMLATCASGTTLDVRVSTYTDQ